MISAAIMHGYTVLIGDRVKHFGQRYGYGNGTATVVGFKYDENGNLKVLIEPDGGHSAYGNEWDADRTEAIELV